MSTGSHEARERQLLLNMPRNSIKLEHELTGALLLWVQFKDSQWLVDKTLPEERLYKTVLKFIAFRLQFLLYSVIDS